MFWCVLLCLGAFGTVSTPYKTWFKTGQTGAINAEIHATNSRRKFSQRPDLIHPIGPKSHVLLCFMVFRCFWDCFVALRNTLQNGPNWCNQCKRSCHAVAMEYFTNNTPDPPHWTLNSCFGVFRSVWGAFVTVSSFYETQFKTGRIGAINANVRAMKSRCDFSQRTHLIHPIGP